MPPFLLRASIEQDVPAIAAIYSYYVLHTATTFEVTPPKPEEVAKRRATILKLELPHLVAEQEGRVIGCAYANEYRARPAYRFTVEDSVYIHPQYVGKGCGTALLSAVIERCEAGPWRQMIAVIANTGNDASVRLHRRLSFEMAGALRSVGFKFGQWIDTFIMQRALGAGDSAPPAA